MGGVWRESRSIADLGQNMALWLEGRGPAWPGYGADFGYEEEADVRHLVPVLAAAGRAGFVTTCSQPGYESGGTRQRAWVEGIVHDRNPLLGRLLGLERQGFTVIRGSRTPHLVLTEEDGHPFTTLGYRARRDWMAREWHGVSRHALRELRQHGVTLHLIDMTWGRDNRLWPALANAVR
ncbi:DUF6919 domain-containing protein [Streptomyces sp. NPDC059447]|uniref:DUF6919 domain-containing protein n=1 Tax=Streptomyces sp. NPDC059447 TaxID=3346834 RepID=UPI00367A18C0